MYICIFINIHTHISWHTESFVLPFQIFPQVSLLLGSQNLATVTHEILCLCLHLQLLCLRCAHGDAKTAVIFSPKHWRLLWKNTAQVFLIATFMLFFLLDFFVL